jgi:hypothetical protein
MPIDLPLAAEVEIPVQWIAYRPAAVVGQKRVDRLSFPARYLLDRRAGASRRAFDCSHKTPYAKFAVKRRRSGVTRPWQGILLPWRSTSLNQYADIEVQFAHAPMTERRRCENTVAAERVLRLILPDRSALWAPPAILATICHQPFRPNPGTLVAAGNAVAGLFVISKATE